jgi:hypothetical protein
MGICNSYLYTSLLDFNEKKPNALSKTKITKIWKEKIVIFV